MKYKESYKKLIILVVAITVLNTGNIIVADSFNTSDGIEFNTANGIEFNTDDVRGIILDYSFKMPLISEVFVFNQMFDSIKLSDLPLTDNAGQPRLPVKSINVLLPQNSVVKSINIEGTKHELQGKYNIEPAQKPIPINSDNIINNEKTKRDMILSNYMPEDLMESDLKINKFEISPDNNYYNPILKEFEFMDNKFEDNFDYENKNLNYLDKDLSIYESYNSFPGILYKNQGIQQFRGYQILIINLYPVQYIPKEGKIYYYSDFNLKIETSEKRLDNEMYSGLTKDEELVKEMVENPQMVSCYHKDMDEPTFNSLSIVDPADSYQYVIITNNTLKSASGTYTFQDLRDHKIANGMSATIVTVEDIYANYGGYDHQEKIRNFIIDAYYNWETDYILLGGDTKDIAGPNGDVDLTVFPTLTVGDYDTYNEGLILGYPDQDLVISNLYYDAMSYFDTSYSSNIAMATSDGHIYAVGETPDIYYSGTAAYLKLSDPDIQPDIEYMSYMYRGSDTYNYLDPDIGADGTNIAWVYTVENPGSYDIFCWYSHDDFDNIFWSYPASSSNDEMYPAVYVDGITFYVAYVDASSNHVYYTTSTDGISWSPPVQVDSTGGAVAEPGCVDIDPTGVVWIDSRNGNKDIYFYSFSSLSEIQVTSDTKDDIRPQLVNDNSGNLLIGYTQVISSGSDTDVLLKYSSNEINWFSFTTPWGAETGIQTGPDLIYDAQRSAVYGTYADNENILTRVFKIPDILNSVSCTTNGWMMSGQTSAKETAITYWWTDSYTYSTTQAGIPARSLYVNGEYMPSDLYYACLDGTYNSDGDYNFGEPTDGPGGTDVDLYAEVYVGRAPADNENDVSNFVKKTINYDITPQNDPYLEDVLMTGEYLGFSGPGDWGGNHMDELVDGTTNHGYTTIGIPSSIHNMENLYDRNGIMIQKTLSIDVGSYIVDPSNFLFGFRLIDDGWIGTDDSTQKAGAYIDDIEVKIDGTTSVFSDDMESGGGKWFTYPINGVVNEWEIGSPVLNPEIYGGIPHSGSNCWATDLDDEYDDLHDGMLQTTNYIDASGALFTIDISFYWWYCTEYRDYTDDSIRVYFFDGSSQWYYWSFSGCNGWDKQEIIDSMNNDVHMIHHLGHSWDDYTMKMDIGTRSPGNDVLGLTNNKYFFAYSQGCWPGAFDNVHGYDCIAEDFVNSEHGAFAVIMNARSGYGAWSSTDGASQRYHREFIDAIYDENMPELGKANHDSKHDNIWRINDGVMRWCCYETNLFGDPALKIKLPDTEQPEVVTSHPADSDTDILISKPIEIIFSEEIDTTSFSYSCSPDPGGWSTSWSSFNTKVTLNHNDFDYGILYTFTINEADDMATNNLKNKPVSFSFTTTASVLDEIEILISLDNMLGDDIHPRICKGPDGVNAIVYEKLNDIFIFSTIPVVWSNDGEIWNIYNEFDSSYFIKGSGVLQYPDIVYSSILDKYFLTMMDPLADLYNEEMAFIEGDMTVYPSWYGISSSSASNYYYSAGTTTGNFFLNSNTHDIDSLGLSQAFGVGFFTYPDFERPPVMGGYYFDGNSVHVSAPGMEIEMDTGSERIYITCETAGQITIKSTVSDETLLTNGEQLNGMDKYADVENWPGEYISSGSDPDISTSGDKVCVVYVDGGNIKCSRSICDGSGYDPGHSWELSTVSIGGSCPAVHMDNNIVYCGYVKDYNVYKIISEDYGETWGSPEQINSVAGTVVDEPGSVDIVDTGIVWTDNRNGQKDIYYSNFREYGDAPEGISAVAYPSTMTMGSFPTCKCCGPAGYIEHNNFGAYFGPAVDFESDGNAGLCGGTTFPPYDQDECFLDGDAGLIMPDPFTIDSFNTVVPCPLGAGTPLGLVGQTAVWGTDIDIFVHNTMPNHPTYLPAYVNFLVDWNQDGDWEDAGEHVLVDYVIPPLYIGPLSGLMTPGSGFTIGSNPGYVWTRFSITERTVGSNWNGTGVFEDGESEDYLLEVLIDNPPVASYIWSDADGGGTGTLINFDASGSSDDIGITTYEWDWDDDGSYDHTGGPTASYDYSDCNPHDCRLRVTDTAFQTDTVMHSVQATGCIVDNPPVASYIWSDADGGGTGTLINFDASGSSDDIGITTYEWDWDDDGSYDHTGGPTASYDYSDCNPHDCRLRVTDTAFQTDTVMHSVQATGCIGITVHIDLKSTGQGWNLITIPVVNSMTMASQLAGNITGCLTVNKWDNVAQTYHGYIVGGPSAFDFPIYPGMGLFVEVSTDSTLTLTGTLPAPVSIDLKIPWSLIGWYNQTSTMASSLAENITGCLTVNKWDNAAQTYHGYIVGGPSAFDFPITAGMGLFVEVDTESTWHGEG